MPDSRSHRGPHPSDKVLFAEANVPVLQTAAAHLAWLLENGYAEPSALKIVGDRFALTARQRMAVARAACGDTRRHARSSRQITSAELRGRSLWIDGFNVLTTLEVSLSGGVVLLCRDGCMRDIAGMHGHYRMLQETKPAVDLLRVTLEELKPASVTWHLDQPVSNSGRLAQLLRESLSSLSIPVAVQLVPNPDDLLISAPGEAIIATADSMILDRCGRWFNLVRFAVETHVRPAWIVSMEDEAGSRAKGLKNAG